VVSNGRSIYAEDMPRTKRPARDAQLVQIVDRALQETAAKSGDWLACRPGCTQCCIGPFAINQLDALRLREGLAALETSDPHRASRVRRRAQASVRRLRRDFPGDAKTGALDMSESGMRKFEGFANDEPCPVLDPDTGLCDLYDYRPMTCRVFGPPVRSEEGLGVCELCFKGATQKQIAACEMMADPEDLESTLLREVESKSGLKGDTIVAFCLNK
jgi:Fe-S-cluster containining protein